MMDIRTAFALQECSVGPSHQSLRGFKLSIPFCERSSVQVLQYGFRNKHVDSCPYGLPRRCGRPQKAAEVSIPMNISFDISDLCAGSFVAFGYGGANLWNCVPWIDAAMQPYLAWYNGSTTITHGDGDCTNNTTFLPVKNAFAVGGVTVPNNSSLDRTSYDKNPY